MVREYWSRNSTEVITLGGDMNKIESRRHYPLLNLIPFFALAILAFSPASVSAQSCEKLAELKLSNTTITSAQSVAAGAFVPASGPATPYRDLPEFCRVTGVIKPTSDSDIKFEVW